MKTYILKPEIGFAFIPGVGRVRPGQLIHGDYDQLLGKVLLAYEEETAPVEATRIAPTAVAALPSSASAEPMPSEEGSSKDTLPPKKKRK